MRRDEPRSTVIPKSILKKNNIHICDKYDKNEHAVQGLGGTGQLKTKVIKKHAYFSEKLLVKT